MDSDGKVSNKVSFGTCFKRGWDVFWANWVAFAVAGLLAGIITFCSACICLGPMMVGLCMMALAALREGKKVKIGDVFQGFKKFVPSFVVVLVFGLLAILISSVVSGLVFGLSFVITLVFSIIPVIGSIIALIITWPLYYVSGLTILPLIACGRWALLKIADGQEDIGKSISGQFSELTNGKFWWVILVFFLAGFVASAGLEFMIIGIFLTSPLAVCIVAAAYEEAYSRKGVSEAKPTSEVVPEA